LLDHRALTSFGTRRRSDRDIAIDDCFGNAGSAA
jgi:hypothetical protein